MVGVGPVACVNHVIGPLGFYSLRQPGSTTSRNATRSFSDADSNVVLLDNGMPRRKSSRAAACCWFRLILTSMVSPPLVRSICSGSRSGLGLRRIAPHSSLPSHTHAARQRAVRDRRACAGCCRRSGSVVLVSSCRSPFGTASLSLLAGAHGNYAPSSSKCHH